MYWMMGVNNSKEVEIDIGDNMLQKIKEKKKILFYFLLSMLIKASIFYFCLYFLVFNKDSSLLNLILVGLLYLSSGVDIYLWYQMGKIGEIISKRM